MSHRIPTPLDLLDHEPVDTAATVTARHDRLAAEAARRGLVDLAYRRVDSPLGPLLLVASDQGLVRLAFAV